MNIHQVFIVLILFSWVCGMYEFFQEQYLLGIQALLFGIILKIGFVNILISEHHHFE
jgi:hypothetical protein